MSGVVDGGNPTGAERAFRDHDPVLLIRAADRIYDVLVRTCDAPEAARLEFRRFCAGTNEPCEFRFIGALGFGGKFWTHGWYVTCYPEDKTPERVERIQRANAALAVLRG